MSADYGLSSRQLMDIWREIRSKKFITRSRADLEWKMQRPSTSFRYKGTKWITRPRYVGSRMFGRRNAFIGKAHEQLILCCIFLLYKLI